MKILKINNKKCFFDIGNGEKTILDITKEDILKILEYLYENNDAEFDEYIEDDIGNEAEKVIYNNLYNKFIDFTDKKETLKNEINMMFNELEEKYIKE